MTDFVNIQFNDQNIDVNGFAEVLPFCLISACPIFSSEAREGSVWLCVIYESEKYRNSEPSIYSKINISSIWVVFVEII